MRRREFLESSARSALALPLASLTACKRQGSTPGEAADPREARSPVAGLEEQIPALMEEKKVPGLSMAIVQEGKLHWARGFGVKRINSNEPVDTHTMFEAASMSKPVFAYAALKLCEKGVLGIDTPLTRYTKERYVTDDPRLDLITARHILTHTSGLPNWRQKGEPIRLQFTPGEGYSYSGEGFCYLQSVITQLTGKVDRSDCATYENGVEFCATDIDPYLKARLLNAFGMKRSTYVWNDACEEHMAHPHDQRGQVKRRNKSNAKDAARYASAGALLSTPSDYARFLIEVLSPMPSDEFRLSEATRAEMLRPQVEVSKGEDYAIHWSLGWRVALTKHGNLHSHGGDNSGFHCLAEISASRQSGFVLMTNSDGGAELLQILAPKFSERVNQA